MKELSKFLKRIFRKYESFVCWFAMLVYSGFCTTNTRAEAARINVSGHKVKPKPNGKEKTPAPQ